MNRLTICRTALGAGLALSLALMPAPGTAQNRPPILPRRPAPLTQRPTPDATATTTFTPRFEAVAETRLLMEGMLFSNYRSLHQRLKEKPADRDTWVFARGQALLVAEAGNLLLLRPPRGTGRDPWMRMAMDMRSQATRLGRAAAAKDHARSLQALTDLGTSCKRCHQTFRVDAKIDPEPAAPDMDAE